MHRTPEQREQILDEYERSGLSGPKFAALYRAEHSMSDSILHKEAG
jgi:hypothetical protein